MTANQMANHWCFTVNNPTEDPEDWIGRIGNLDKVRYIVMQLEQGENGTPHWQGYVELTRSQRLSWLKRNIHPTAHYERRGGTRQQARQYCMKEDTVVSGPWEHGIWNAGGQGKRTDIVAFKEAIQSGKRKRDLVDEFTHEMCKYPKFYDTVRSLYRPDRLPETFVGAVLLYGWTGIGKTRFVKENYPEHWESSIGNGTSWYDGYDSQSVVLFDDFAGSLSKATLDTTLKLFDIYVRSVPVKGGHVWWNPNIVFVTTNIHPRSWYKWENRESQYPALCRRFSYVYWYKKDGTVDLINSQNDLQDFWDLPHLYEETE